MSDPIKSADLCNRCKHSSNCKNYDYCHGCPMKLDYVGCSCMTIKMNTPCPYFEEAKDDDSFPEQKIQRYIR